MVVSQACAETDRRAKQLRDALEEHGIRTQAKTDLDGSIWLRFTQSRRAYDLIVTSDASGPRCMLLTCVDTFSEQDEHSRYVALERINTANLQTQRGLLVLTPLGSVNAMAGIDGVSTAEQILLSVSRLNAAISAYENTAA